MDIVHCLSALLFLSQLVGAAVVGSDRSIQALSVRAKSKTTKTNTGRRVSIALVVIIIIVIVAILIGLAFIVFLCRRRSSKKANKQALNMEYIRTSTGKPSSEARREGDWWQPPHETLRNSTRIANSNNPNAPYSQGGQGYTYGVTAEQSQSTTGRLSPDTRTIADTRTSVHGGLPQDEPFQIPVAPFSRPPGRPASITPSYHTEAAGGDLSVESGGMVQNNRLHVPPSNPPTQFQPRQPVQPLQPQHTGGSIYTSPYGGMTYSTSGHPGE